MPRLGVKKLSRLSYSRYGISPPIFEFPVHSRSVTPGMFLPGLNVMSEETKAYRSPAKKSLPGIRTPRSWRNGTVRISTSREMSDVWGVVP